MRYKIVDIGGAMPPKRKTSVNLSVADEQNIKVILDAHPYLSGNVTAAISLAIYELGKKIVIANDFTPAPIIPKESEDDE